MEETHQVLAGRGLQQRWWEPDPRVRWRPPCLHFPPFAILAAGEELLLSQLQKLFRRCCSHKVSRVQNLVRTAEALHDRSVQQTTARLRRTAVLSPLGLATPAPGHHSDRVQMAALRNAQQRVQTQIEHARRNPQGRGTAGKFTWTGRVGAVASGAPVDFCGVNSARRWAEILWMPASWLPATVASARRSTPRTSWR